VGGDLTGKMIVPITKQPNGQHSCEFLESKHLLRSQSEVADMEKTIGDAGFYSYVAEISEIEELRRDRTKFDALINHLIIERMKEWIQLADERLAGLNIKFFMLAGNDDNPKCDELISASKFVRNPTGKVVDLDGLHEMISLGVSNITPWKTAGEYPEEELEKMLEAMIASVKDQQNCILNLHVPPYDSGLDIAPELNEQLQPVLVGGEVTRIPVGSTAVRKIIEKYQPRLGLFGHIHESAGEAFIGRTLCINPGSEYSEGILRGYVVDLDDKGIRQFFRVEG
jgi:Icc-related predicted phosphoesterase